MPGVALKRVKSEALLADAYRRTTAKITAREIPTIFIEQGQAIYRAINPSGAHTYLPKPAAGCHVSRLASNRLLIPPDGNRDFGNRFSGPSNHPDIPPASGLYCVLQQQALVNEATHYSGRLPQWALVGKCVLRIRLMARLLVADLSPHNPRGRRFFRSLGDDVWDRVNDPRDCSSARGIGLAVAHSGFLDGLCVQTVRSSERSDEERGDNLVLFTSGGKPPRGLYIDKAYYFGKKADPEIFPVEFP